MKKTASVTEGKKEVLNTRSENLISLLSERILVLDGASGTYLQNLELGPEDFGGDDLEGCNENLILTRPEIIQTMHETYLEAGADIVETNTFGATPLVLAEYDLQEQTHQINLRGAQLARAAADKFSTSAKPRFVAGSIGPTTKAITVTGGVTFSELVENFQAQTLGLIEGGSDYLLVETCQDTRNIKAAIIGIKKAFGQLGTKLPIAVSGTIEATGTMLAGQGVEALFASLDNHDLLYLGLNCATGPSFMTDHVRSLAALSHFPVSVVPNAGLPDEDGMYLETPAMVSDVLARFIENDWVNVVGGCCGTTPDHVTALASLAAGKTPRVPVQEKRSIVSGVDFLELTDEIRPVIVGERTNAVGSRAFKRMIVEEKFEEASEIARKQVNSGAQIIDINLANPDRDEMADMEKFLGQVINKIKAPIMIDSTDEKVIALALPYLQGKGIINSINLEDGLDRFEKVVPLAKKYGAALVVGTIDEDPESGMAVTRQRKLEIAQRSHDLLTTQFDIPAEDIYFDPLVFPCATGDENYIGSAEETIEGIRLIKEALPGVKTILGVSNISFGLPPAGREVLNAVFLYHCVQAGLDMAIVNAEKLQRFASIPEEEKKLSDDLLFNRGDDPIALFADHFRGKKPQVTQADRKAMPLNERLSRAVVDGSKDGLLEDLDEAMTTQLPLQIVNGPLMTGMDEVGRLFNTNKLIVAEVLQSAEVMKAAVAHLEPHMDKDESALHGTLLLATVKGDVHDIGKNLVDIIFTNNGYKVINLGIKIPPETLISAFKEHKPDLIGLSGLLVKSAQQMVITAEDMKNAGVDAPILVGGAALSRGFTHKRIQPAYGEGMVVYAQDAMAGLGLAHKLTNENEREALKIKLAEESAEFIGAAEIKAPKVEFPAVRSSRISVDIPILSPPDTNRHTLKNLPLDEIWAYINPQMLYGRHMGLRGNANALLEAKDPKAMELKAVFDELKEECRKGWMSAHAVWQFFNATSEGNTLTLYEGEKAVADFQLPRQPKPDGMALPDLILPPDGKRKDNLAMLITTAGGGISKRVEQLKNDGAYLKSHALAALALETAEASAEWVHGKIRAMWGFPDPPEMTSKERFQAKYRGKRYSFGYPACPNLADQEPLFKLLEPGQIGIELTEGFMMEPEASVSALAFHHPDASYFSVGPQDED